jgi:DNA-binding transcriptional ArsR family regulator
VKTLSDETLSKVAVFLKSIAEPTRLKILRSIHDEEKTVSEIMAETECTQSNVSKHLAILAASHIVTFRKEGTSIYYKITDPNITAICDTVCRSIAVRIRHEKVMLQDIKRGIRSSA